MFSRFYPKRQILLEQCICERKTYAAEKVSRKCVYKSSELLNDPRSVERHAFFHRFLSANHPKSKTYK